MGFKKFSENNQANEEISKFKLLSAYGGPGSIIHTEYGSVIISCIEEWGFIQQIKELHEKREQLLKDFDYVIEEASFKDLKLSNDERLLEELRIRKKLKNLTYLVLIPDIELNEVWNTVKDHKTSLAINSTFMPKGFFDKMNHYKKYHEWYYKWPKSERDNFFPPKYRIGAPGQSNEHLLKQDNIVLICNNGHISDFPWSKFLRWRIEHPDEVYNYVDLFSKQNCCDRPNIQIHETSANASGFDGKWLKCVNEGCVYTKGTSLKGLMSVKIACPGHKPWEVQTEGNRHYFGDSRVRRSDPIDEVCDLRQHNVQRNMKVALTTGNNLYFSRILSSIYMPRELFKDDLTLKLEELERQKEEAKKNDDFTLAISLNDQIKELKANVSATKEEGASDSERELNYRFQEFKALSEKSEEEINVNKDLKVKDVTNNLSAESRDYFSRVLRIDNLKVTSTQLDFSRVEPYDSDIAEDAIKSKNIFRSSLNNVITYPVVENFGEGIFFALNEALVNQLGAGTFEARLENIISRPRNEFAQSAVRLAEEKNWQLYLVHTFCHLIMRELEFRCGYPTASLLERIYVSNEEETKMYGCMIYTAEGAEGSMGGLIVQTRERNLNGLIKSALRRATVCNSDPLCWESDGQGLFELNLASCFSCSLVSETSCELRNIYLDRRILVDDELGFFKGLVK